MERYHTPDTAQQLFENLTAPTPEIVVVSGGPCAGKTTLLEQLPAAAQVLSKTITIMPEVATQLIQEGVDFSWLAAHDRPAYLNVQRRIIREELDFVTSALKHYRGTDTVILLDRGISDTFSYMTSHEARTLAAEHSKTPHQLGYDNTDRVVYLPSLALSNPAAYDIHKGSNAGRYEAASEAAITCRRTLEQWAQHPELHIADSPDFTDKLRRAAQFCLGGDQEYEQKWETTEAEAQMLINGKVDSGEMLSMTQLIQQYGSLDDQPFRLRRGQTHHGYQFFHFAVKQRGRELRRSISEEQFRKLSPFAPKLLTKIRYNFLDHNHIWHADYVTSPRNHHGKWLLEAEVSHPSDLLQLKPPLPRTTRKVTFSNHDLVQ